MMKREKESSDTIEKELMSGQHKNLNGGQADKQIKLATDKLRLKLNRELQGQ